MRELSKQVELIVEHLLDDDFLETDGGDPGDEEVLKVAQCLRKLGDEYNQIIQPHVKNLQPKLHELAKDQSADILAIQLQLLTDSVKELELDELQTVQGAEGLIERTYGEEVTPKASEVFSGIVTGLCNTPEMQAHAQQLGPEINLLGIAVVVGMNISKEMPHLLPTVKVALTNFINTRLLPWIQHSGGWEKIL